MNRVAFTGEMDGQACVEARQRLLAALAPDGTAEIDATSVTKAGLGFLQLLVAAARQYPGLALTPDSPALAEAAERGGLMDHAPFQRLRGQA